MKQKLAQKPYMSGYIFMDWKFPEIMKDFDYSILNNAFVEADIPSIFMDNIDVVLNNRVFTAVYMEFENLPVYKFHYEWAKLMLNDWDNRSKYYAQLKYWTTLEDGVSVQYQETYKNVYPLLIPDNRFGHNVSEVKSVKLHIPYHVEFTKYLKK